MWNENQHTVLQSSHAVSGCHVALFPVYCKQANWVVRRVAGGRHVVCIKPVNINRQSAQLSRNPSKFAELSFTGYGMDKPEDASSVWNQSKTVMEDTYHHVRRRVDSKQQYRSKIMHV